ncbi:MAG: hypothetical protein ABW061_07045 [Polyangiaceae bacterium]
MNLLLRLPSAVAQLALLALALSACGGQKLDAGSDLPHGVLPIDERNPVILSNDGVGNWYGLYAVLFANSGGPELLGIAVNSSSYATSLSDNLDGWQTLVTAARASGLRGIPDPIASVGAPLTRPSTGDLDATIANESDGARLIVEASARSSAPDRPVVVVAGGRLTDVADAYLMDHAVADRVVVVAALGSNSATGGVMGAPNGELDPWADWIVTQRFPYIQVSAFYDATSDLPSSELAALPMNPLGTLVAAQAPDITNVPSQADQVSILAAGLPEFVASAARATLDSAPPGSSVGPTLVPSVNGPHWLVTRIDPTVASARLRQMLHDPKTFAE